MTTRTVAGLWRYPVKSMGGERLPAATLTPDGIPGDRRWGVWDNERAGRTGAKRLPMLRLVTARYIEEPVVGGDPPDVELSTADGPLGLGSDAATATKLSGFLGRSVSLFRLRWSEPSPELVRPAADAEREYRQLMGLEPGEPLPDLSAFPPELLRELRAETLFDAYPLHVLTTSTLAAMRLRLPDAVWDARRFRPNVLVDSPDDDGFAELAWEGRRCSVGSATVDVVAGCPRCSMAAQAVDELAKDTRIMRTLVREAAHLAGVYATCSQAGDVRVGDPFDVV